jgi:hypothetical protein
VSAEVPKGSGSGCNACAASRCAVEQRVAMGSCDDGGCWARNARRARIVPVGFSCAGLMVPDASMMPFPMPPFDMTGCMEYIPPVRAKGELADG